MWWTVSLAVDIMFSESSIFSDKRIMTTQDWMHDSYFECETSGGKPNKVKMLSSLIQYLMSNDFKMQKFQRDFPTMSDHEFELTFK